MVRGQRTFSCTQGYLICCHLQCLNTGAWKRSPGCPIFIVYPSIKLWKRSFSFMAGRTINTNKTCSHKAICWAPMLHVALHARTHTDTLTCAHMVSCEEVSQFCWCSCIYIYLHMLTLHYHVLHLSTGDTRMWKLTWWLLAGPVDRAANGQTTKSRDLTIALFPNYLQVISLLQPSRVASKGTVQHS